MSSSVQNIIDQGTAKSSAARPNTQTSPQELVDRVGQCLREIALSMSREHPDMLAGLVAVPFNGTGFPRPADCLRVLKVQATAGTIANPAIPAGTEIAVVPFDDQGVYAGVPCLTELGQVFIATGQTMDPTGGSVGIIYARNFATPVLTTDLLDPLYPSPLFDDILNYDMAAYLATKDKRTEDEQTFLAMKGAGLGQLFDWAKQQTYSLVQRFPVGTPPLTNTNEGRAQPAKGSG
jgi:hypothetical protein